MMKFPRSFVLAHLEVWRFWQLSPVSFLWPQWPCRAMPCLPSLLSLPPGRFWMRIKYCNRTFNELRLLSHLNKNTDVSKSLALLFSRRLQRIDLHVPLSFLDNSKSNDTHKTKGSSYLSAITISPLWHQETNIDAIRYVNSSTS